MSAPQTEHRRLETVARPKQARAERTLHRLLDAAEGLIEERGAGDVSIPEIVRGCMRELVLVFRERRALIHTFVARALQDVEFRGAALAFEREVADAITGLLLVQSGEVRHPLPQRAIPLAVAIVFGSMVMGVLIGDARHPFAQLSDDEAAEELARNFLGYSSLGEAFRRT